MNLDEKISPILKKIRLTKEDLRTKMGISKSTFFLWMKESIEKRTLEQINLLAQILDVPVTELLDKQYSVCDDVNITMLQESLSVYKELAENQKELLQHYKNKNKVDKS